MKWLWYRLLWYLLPKLKIINKYPIHLDIEVTNLCNLKCKMCMRDLIKDGQGYMPFGIFKTIFNEYVPYSIKLNWRGEPLLHRDIIEFVKYAKDKGVIEVAFNTNGHFINQELLHKLAKAGLDLIIFSVDGVTKPTYEKIRVGGNFEKLVKNLILTRMIFMQYGRSRPKIRIQICPQEDNLSEIEAWKDTFKMYADKLRIGKLHDIDDFKGYDIKQSKDCTSLWQRLVISWNGNIYPCCADWAGKFKLGNIKDITIKQAWNNSFMKSTRKLLIMFGRNKTPFCKKCSSYC